MHFFVLLLLVFLHFSSYSFLVSFNYGIVDIFHQFCQSTHTIRTPCIPTGESGVYIFLPSNPRYFFIFFYDPVASTPSNFDRLTAGHLNRNTISIYPRDNVTHENPFSRYIYYIYRIIVSFVVFVYVIMCEYVC